MTLLMTGLMIWCLVHLFPAACVTTRDGLIRKFGPGPYKGIFALLIVTSIVLMVLGWRSIQPEDIYHVPVWGRHVTYLLALITFILFVAAKRKTNIKRILRHPQLTGLVLWSIGHLLANGEQRSLALFTTLGLWAIVEMVMINRRTGPWIKPDPLPMKNDVITVLIGIVLFSVLLLVHQYIAGVRLVTF